MLRPAVIIAGLCWSVAFIVVGLLFRLQLYGDGSIFSYSVAVQDAWAFHWHNLSGRIAVYLLTLVPAEIYVALTGSPNDGIAAYGLLFFTAPLAGLAATYAADRSKGRRIFCYACASTACLCPLVFGFPTETWMAHSIFWPALAVSHFARRGTAGAIAVFAALLALVFTHEGALVLATAIVVTLALRGLRDPAFLRGLCALLAALAIWAAVKIMVPPDDYFADVIVRAALDFFDAKIFDSKLVRLLLIALAGYAVLAAVLRRVAPSRAPVYAATIVVAALAVYWLRFDQSLLAANRYYLRTACVVFTPTFGALAAFDALLADGRLMLDISLLTRGFDLLARPAAVSVFAGAFALVMLMHVVETAKFAVAWTRYKDAVRVLATGTASDPSLGDPRFVSSARIGAALNRLSWFSTTQYLSVVVADFAPTRLVLDPADNYFWLSCATATANLNAARAVPADARRLIQIHACQHRR